jgi:hypothetical protein
MNRAEFQIACGGSSDLTDCSVFLELVFSN